MRNAPTFESWVMSTSVIPSEKYSCSGSWERLSRGRTANDSMGFPRAPPGRALWSCFRRKPPKGLGGSANLEFWRFLYEEQRFVVGTMRGDAAGFGG